MSGDDRRFDGLRHTAIGCIKDIDATNPPPQSIEWFLVRYLQRIVKKTEPPARPAQIEGSVRSLIRFYVDNIDSRSELGRACVRIHEEYRRALREYRRGDA